MSPESVPSPAAEAEVHGARRSSARESSVREPSAREPFARQPSAPAARPAPLPEPARSHVAPGLLAVQEWDGYTEAQHGVWRTLFRRRMERLPSTASRVFLEGIDAIGLSEEGVPDLREVNGRLSALTGWEAVPVTGFLSPRDFFHCLSVRRFPTTVTIRPPESLDYTPEPDVFHDVFGHVPLHSDPVFADFLQRFGSVALRARTEEETTAMTRLFWFTVEFGLIREGGEVRIYGSGLISSGEDAANALGPGCDRRPFGLDAVVRQDFAIDRIQDVLFVVEGFDGLFEAVEEAGRRLG